MFEKQQLTISLMRDNWHGKCHLTLIQANYEALTAQQKYYLTSKEHSKLQTFPVKTRKHQFLLGRFCAKTSLVEALGGNFYDYEIMSGVFNQPIVSAPVGCNQQVSIAHSEDLGVAITFDQAHPMGIDVEVTDPSKIHVIASQMTEKELEILNSLDRQLGLTVAWTVKEALSKVLKCGLMTPFKVLEIAGINYYKHYIECTFSYFTGLLLT